MKRENETILVVDDNETGRDLLCRRLEKNNYCVEPAEDGYQALEKMKNRVFDLVLLDMMMPGISGLQTLSSLRRRHSLAELPVIMVTAKDGREDTVNALRMGANDYVTKPVDFDILAARIDVQLQRKREDTEFQNRLLRATRTLNSHFDLNSLITELCHEARSLFDTDLVHIWMLDEAQQALVLKVKSEQRPSSIKHGYVVSLDHHQAAIVRAFHKGKSDVFQHLEQYSPATIDKKMSQLACLKSAIVLPLRQYDRVMGVIVMGDQSRPVHFGPSELEKARLFVSQIEGSLSRATLLEHLESSAHEMDAIYENTLEGWIKALDLRDNETEGHARRVADLTLVLARALKVPESELTHIRRGALLHDIGKMAVPDEILKKTDVLNEAEWAIMRQHPAHAYQWLSNIEYLKPAVDIPYCHHEHWDGNGYPQGLKGEQIPLHARIFSVVDVWDALTSDRPYRRAWPKQKALDHIRRQAGRQFDPEVVDAFLNIIGQRSAHRESEVA